MLEEREEKIPLKSQVETRVHERRFSLGKVFQIQFPLEEFLVALFFYLCRGEMGCKSICYVFGLLKNSHMDLKRSERRRNEVPERARWNFGQLLLPPEFNLT